MTKSTKTDSNIISMLNMKNFFSVSREEVEPNGKPRRVATSCREV